MAEEEQITYDLYKVFISHYSAEAPLAEAVKGVLERAYVGIKVEVFTSLRIPRGTDWLAKVKGYLNGADEIVSIFTHHSVERPWLNIETGYGIMSGKIVTPLLCRGFNIGDLSDPYRTRQAVNSAKKIDVIDFYNDIHSRIRRKNPYAEKRYSDQEFWEIWDSNIRSAASSVPIVSTRPRPRPVVWLIGSHRHLPDRRQQQKALQVCDVIARLCVDNGIQILMGTSRMLEYLSDEYVRYSESPEKLAEAEGEEIRKTLATKQAQASTIAPNPVVLLGSLRRRGIRETFDEAIGRIPDMAIVIAGRPPREGGRSIQETKLAAEGNIPVLPISFTGGAAAVVEQTLHPDLRHKEQELQLMGNRLDDFGPALLELIEKQTEIGRGDEIA